MTSAPTSNPPHINLTINGAAVSVPKGTTVYNAARQLGIDIPIFCYQDRMPPFGACRMCLVEVEKMPKLQTSCTLEVTEGMVVKTQSQVAVEGREGILELLLINHPLDCPICDRGGECPLQDQAFKHGPGESKFFEDKRRFKKPIPLGPVLMLDRERCIVCARCTRFGDIVAGDHALEFVDRGFKTEVSTPDGGPAESKFIGNTISICPVGALTSQVYRFRARPWDNDTTNSTCTLCPVGCSLVLDSRDGEIMRTRSRENRDVNDIWLCDKGWFGYEFAYHPERLKTPLIKRNGHFEVADWEEAFSLIASKIDAYKPNGKIGALGGNTITVEECYLLQKLIREGAGTNHLDHRVGMPVFNQDEEALDSGMEISIGECEQLSYAIIFGADLTEEFPIIWLRLKQAIDRGAQIIFVGHYAPETAKYFTKTVLHSPGKELETINSHQSIIAALAKEGKKGALFVGNQYLAHPQRQAILGELSKLCKNTQNLSLNILEGRGNSIGAAIAGMRPEYGPFGEKLTNPGLNVVELLQAGAKSGWDFLYVVGANPAKKYPSQIWNDFRNKLGFMIVQDLFLTETARQADLVLPALCYIEKGGSFINIEGRVQQIQPGKEPQLNTYSDGEIFTFIGNKLGLTMALDQSVYDSLKPGRLPHSRPERKASSKPIQPIAHTPLAATFAHSLFDHGMRMKHDPQLVQLTKEPRFRIHPSEATNYNLQNGDRIEISANGNAIAGKVKLDDKVAKGTVVLPLGFPELPVHELGINLLNGIGVTIKRI